MAATLDIGTLSVIRGESAALIRAEVRSATQRERLERAVIEAITLLNVSIDDVSEASGLAPAEIRRLLARTDAPV
jgi:hypothetical protein